MIDNDTAVFTVTDLEVGEGAGEATFELQLSNPLDIDVDVVVDITTNTAGRLDFDDTSQVLKILKGSNFWA